MQSGDTRSIHAVVWGQASVLGLEVNGDIFGASHRFEHEGHDIEVRVPAVLLDENLRPTDKWRQFARFRSGRASNPTRETNSYEISILEASIHIPEPLTVPSALLDIPPKHPEIAGADLSAKLEMLSVKFEGYLASGVEHWKTVTRWITGSRAIDTQGSSPYRQAQAAFQYSGLFRS